MNSTELVMLGVFGVLLGALWWMNIQLISSKHEETAKIAASLEEKIVKVTSNIPGLDAFKEELIELMDEIVANALSNIEMPSAFDHITGGLMQMVTSKFVNAVPPQIADMIPTLNEHQPEWAEHAEEI